MAISIIRTVILYLAIVLSMRIMGKRQLGEVEPAELVVAVLISDLAANPLQDIGTPLIYGLVPVIVLLLCEILISGLIIKSMRMRTLICGVPSIIIENGTIKQVEMKKNRLTADELAEQLRKKDIIDITTVKYAVLETDGQLSVILRSEDSPITPRQLDIDAEDVSYPVIVINDGRILEENLKILGYNIEWLNKQLGSRKIKNPRDVFMMTADHNGHVFFAAKESI